MKIRKNYKTYAFLLGLISIILVVFVCFYCNSSAQKISFFKLMSLIIIVFIIRGISDICLNKAERGSFLCRGDIKNGATFRLEKITGSGNERFYFIYEGSKKIPYYDSSGFESGWYVKDEDGDLNKVKD